MKGTPITYSATELWWIERHKELPRREAHALFCKVFCRDDVSLTNFAALCKRRGWFTGRTGRYEKGAVPLNKGRKMPFHPACAATQYKAGNLPHNTKFEGHERLNKNGYIEVSVRETNPHTGHERRYVQKHRWLWEKANGPVPEGHALKCLDGDKTNTDPANWIAIPKALLPRLAGRADRGQPGYDQAPAELKPVILASARLAHAAKQAKERRS
ncbi:MAG: HNH endonuclease signature motif containing protein [Pseudomonadota bacterium]